MGSSLPSEPAVKFHSAESKDFALVPNGKNNNGTDLDKTRSSKRLSSMICYKGYFGVSVKDFIDSSMKVFVTSGL